MMSNYNYHYSNHNQQSMVTSSSSSSTMSHQRQPYTNHYDHSNGQNGSMDQVDHHSTPMRPSYAPRPPPTTKPLFVKDTLKYWYKPNMSREEAINILKDRPPGSFIVRDSNSFPNCFGLVLKVATVPPDVTTYKGDPSGGLVRHFLIEPTNNGVRVKGYQNEPVFSSLSALIYEHTLQQFALPCKLVIDEFDSPAHLRCTPSPSLSSVSHISGHSQISPDTLSPAELFAAGAEASAHVLYLVSIDTESLTGPHALRRAVDRLWSMRPGPRPTVVNFVVSMRGISMTDNLHRVFLRKYFPVSRITYCGTDPDNRKWHVKGEGIQIPPGGCRIFGFVAKKALSRENECHLLAEYEPDQPAMSIVTVVNKVLESLKPQSPVIQMAHAINKLDRNQNTLMTKSITS